MAILIYHKNIYVQNWLDALKRVDDSLDIRVYPDFGNADEVLFGLTRAFPKGLWNQFPNLKALSSIGAGVSHILDDDTLNEDLPVLKLVDDRLNQSMWEYLLAIVAYHAKDMHRYRQQQEQKEWIERRPRRFDGTTVAIAGLGSIGNYVAMNLVSLGFNVMGIASSRKELDSIEVCSFDDISDEKMESVDIWISILPLTDQTENIFDSNFFHRVKTGSVFVNVGRGAQVVDNDLLGALDSGKLSSVYLDVFREEPLPNTHPFWTHPEINITPHIASITSPRSVASQIVDNYYRATRGEALKNVVDRAKGY